MDLNSDNLDNPFRLYQDEELDEQVENFVAKHNLDRGSIEPLKHAAHAVKYGYRAPRLLPEERDALEHERDVSFWKQSVHLRSTVVVVGGLSGMCQGFAQSILNGTGPPISTDFNLHVRTDDPKRSNLDLFTYGALVACVPLAAGILSPLLSDPLQNHVNLLGRRGTIFASCLLSIAGTIGTTLSRTLMQIIGCRIVIGTSLGAKASIIAPFLAEIAPVHLRGAILSTWQIADALGILLGFVAWRVVRIFELSASSEWRLLNGLIILPTLSLMIVVYMVPESYIFLMKTRQYARAVRSACSYRTSPFLGYRDIIKSHMQMETEERLRRESRAGPLPNLLGNELPGKCSAVSTADDHHELATVHGHHDPAVGKGAHDARPTTGTGLVPKLASPYHGSGDCMHSYHMKRTNFFKRMWQVVTEHRCQFALLSSGLLMLTQALCGINAFAFFSSSLVNAGLPESDSVALAVSLGAVNFGFGLVTPYLSDVFGRTTLTLMGLPVMAIFMFILAGLFKLDPEGRKASIFVFILLFTAVYSFTLGPAAFSVAAESFPSSVREAAMSLCVAINMTSLGILLLVYPFITAPIGYTWSLTIFGFIDVLAFIACLLVCVDTKDCTLEELQSNFRLKKRRHSKYRLTWVVPETLKHWKEWLMNKWTISPFYQWAWEEEYKRQIGAS